MHFVCISASNIQHARETSASLRACHVIERALQNLSSASATVDIIPLSDYAPQPCTGCGLCFSTARCANDLVFNELYQRVLQCDGLFIVSAHYSPIPAKLCMLLEKMEQITFLPRFHNKDHRSPLYGRPVGLVGHGGGGAESAPIYQAVVIDPIANALSWPIEMQIVKNRNGVDNGVVFPIQRVECAPESAFPIQVHDWDDIRQRLTPLVEDVYSAALAIENKL